MIDIAELRKSDIGRSVIYTSRGNSKNWYETFSRGGATLLRELGTISSWNTTWVFVRYGGELQAKATDPSDLEWAYKAKKYE